MKAGARSRSAQSSERRTYKSPSELNRAVPTPLTDNSYPRIRDPRGYLCLRLTTRDREVYRMSSA